MRTNLVRAWLNSGAPPLEDFAAVLGIHFVTLVRIFDGGVKPDDGLKRRLSLLFDQPVAELFPGED